jgi:P4 family phage/plasmid primase-like protien
MTTATTIPAAPGSRLPHVLDVALAYHAAGLNTIPVRADGSKALALEAGHEVGNHVRRATPEELHAWFAAGRVGVAVKGGLLSGGLEIIDIEREADFLDFATLVEDERPGLMGRLPRVRTPMDAGRHLYYRCSEIAGNQKLASEPDPKAPPGQHRPKTIIETRGEGGYVLAPGCSPRCHPTGRTYELEHGSLGDIPTITPEERQVLLKCARALNRFVRPEPVKGDRALRPQRPDDGDRPGDDFNRRAAWEDVLEPVGWKRVRRRGSITYWCRPGKEHGVSASTGLLSHQGNDLLHVFSSNAWPLELDTNYTKFGAYAALHHNGDHAAAARALGEQGYGNPPAPRPRLYSESGDGRAEQQDDLEAVAVVEAPEDPHLLARDFLGMDRPGYRPWWRYYRDEHFEYTGTHYHVVPDEDVRARVTAAVKDKFDRDNREALAGWKPSKECPEAPTARKVTQALVSNVIQALASYTLVGAGAELPCWVGARRPQGSDFIAMENGILDLGALLEGRHDPLRAHDPDWFSVVCLPYPFDEAATCPRLEACLHRWMEDDAERMALLQEFAGYCMARDSGQQKFLLAEGEGQNGKSVFFALLTALLGEANVSSVPLELFGQRFALTSTLGKLANIASEVGEIDKIAEGVLKSFTSGDSMFFDRKGVPGINAVPTAKLALATNNLPRFTDRSGGVWRRMLLTPFRVTITEEERVVGMDKPSWWGASGELPGAFNWAVAGLRRLRKQGRFTAPKVSVEALNEYRQESNPARVFLVENYEAADANQPGAEVKCAELYRDYKTWAEGNGYRPLGERAFGKEVRRAFPQVERRRLGSRGGQEWHYVGVCCLPVV